MKKKLMFMNKPLTVTRVAAYILGLYIMTMGLAIAICSDFGVSPVTTMPYVFGKMINMSVGTGTLIAYVLYILIQIPVYGKHFKPIYVLQFPAALMFGWFTDLNKALLTPLGTPESFFVKLLWCAVSVVFVSGGLTIVLDADIMAIPPDAMVTAFAWRTGKRVGSVKRLIDLIIVASSLALSLIFLHSYQGFWFGTIIHAFVNGTLLNLWRKLFRRPLLRLLYGREAAEEILAAAPAGAKR